MVTVIIPALNEQDTIEDVVKYCFAEPLVTEVIVVDDQSVDETTQRALAAGATLLISKKRGKGFSMKEGIQSSSNEIIVFLDADIHPYPVSTIKNLVQPILDNQCDFVKGAFARNAGRITELVAKPLLNIFYPELSSFQQPLSGMIAGQRSLFNKIEFFHDYGVDIGILIDMYLMQARVKEINIGYIENKSKPWKMLGKMSGEVARAIIKRATHQQQNLVNLEELGMVNIISSEMEKVMKEEIGSLRKIFVFDLDNTLIQGKFIDAAAQKFYFTDELNKLRSIEKDAATLVKRIAKLLKGLSLGDLLKVASSIPLVDDTISVVNQLRKQGNVVGIISDSYQFMADYVKTKLGADFALANQLDFFEGQASGEVTIPSYFFNHHQSKCAHKLCKTNALIHLAKKSQISLENCITVTGSGKDLCMTQHAGMGIAFCSKNHLLRNAADITIDKPSFADLLNIERFYTKENKIRLSI